MVNNLYDSLVAQLQQEISYRGSGYIDNTGQVLVGEVDLDSQAPLCGSPVVPGHLLKCADQAFSGTLESEAVYLLSGVIELST